jgi:hypothetical protein
MGIYNGRGNQKESALAVVRLVKSSNLQSESVSWRPRRVDDLDSA